MTWLLTYAAHSTILLAGAWLISRRLRSHVTREALWKTALFGGFVTATVQTGLHLTPLSGRVEVTRASASALLPDPDPGIVRTSSDPKSSDPAEPRSGATSSPSPISISGDSARVPASLSVRSLLVFAWLGIAGFLLAIYAIRRGFLARRIAGRRPVMTHPLADLLRELAVEAGITRPIRLTTSPSLASPIALGASEIAVPEAALTELDPDQQRGMLAHELAHLTRRDPAWLTAASLAERIGFFQPLNRLARRRIQESAEYLCDEWAVRRTGSEGGVSLATCLAKVAEWMDARPTVPVAGMAEERSHLVARVRRLLEGGPFPAGPSRATIGALAGLVVVAVTVALPAVSPARNRSDRDSSSFRTEALAGVTSQQSDTNPAVIRALMEAARDPEVEVRRAAIHSLRRFEDRTTIALFREALRDEDAEIRVAAIEALTELKDRGSSTAIAVMLRDENTDIRRAAIQSLAELPAPSARAEIIAAIKDTDADVRRGAVHAAAQLKDAAAVEALTLALKDTKPEVRAAAIEALHELELPNPPDGLLDLLRDPNAEVRHEAAHAVGRYQDARAVPILREMLADASAEVREAAVEALAEIRNEAAIDALVAALKSKDPNVRKAAAEALGQR